MRRRRRWWRACPATLKIVDLSADFRLRDPAVYAEWYGHEHRALELQAEAVYGLTEFYREEIRAARLVAGTGCNSATGIYALLPLLRAGVIDPDDIIIDLATGVSGAGRSPKESTLHSEVSEGFHAYNVAKHRHLAEFDQEFAAVTGRPVQVTFVPHLLPQNRGILATVYVRGDAPTIHGVLAEAYAREPFVVVLPYGEAPATRHVRGSNYRSPGRDRRSEAGAHDGVLDAGQPTQRLLRSGPAERKPDARPPRDDGARGRAAVSVRTVWRSGAILWDAIDRFNRNDGTAMAGFIAFSGLLSVFPFLIVAATLIGAMLGDARSDQIIDALFRIAPDHVARPSSRWSTTC